MLAIFGCRQIAGARDGGAEHVLELVADLKIVRDPGRDAVLKNLWKYLKTVLIIAAYITKFRINNLCGLSVRHLPR